MSIRKIMNIKPFEGISKKLDELDEHTKNNIIELIWCIRKGKLSVTVCTFDFESFLNMLHGTHLDIIESMVNVNADGWAVDLESLDDPDMGKFYEYFTNSNKVATGYNLNAEGPFEVKEYFQDDGYIRASKNGNDVNIKEQVEEKVSDKHWPGPFELIEICNRNKLWRGFSNKKDRDQWYMRIRDIGIL